MPNLKNIWFNTFRRRIDKRPMKELMKASGQQIIFPFYHTVSNDDLPHIKHLYRWRNVQEFERDMDFLLRHYTPLHYDDFVSGRYQSNTPYFLLSFDDGLSELFHIVRPILLEKGIPASIFINSAFVDNKALMYRYKVSLLIESIEKEKLAKCIFEGEEKSSVQVREPARFLLQVDSRQEPWIDRIAQRAGFDFDHFLHTQKPYLDLAQINTLRSEGFSIGAHSVDHPDFSTLARSAQELQIQQSVDYVRNNCATQNPPFAFPFTADGIAPDLMRAMHTQFGISKSFGTSGVQKEKYPNHIDRIPAEYKDWPLETIVKAELHYFLAKKMIGK